MDMDWRSVGSSISAAFRAETFLEPKVQSVQSFWSLIQSLIQSTTTWTDHLECSAHNKNCENRCVRLNSVYETGLARALQYSPLIETMRNLSLQPKPEVLAQNLQLEIYFWKWTRNSRLFCGHSWMTKATTDYLRTDSDLETEFQILDLLTNSTWERWATIGLSNFVAHLL